MGIDPITEVELKEAFYRNLNRVFETGKRGYIRINGMDIIRLERVEEDTIYLRVIEPFGKYFLKFPARSPRNIGPDIYEIKSSDLKPPLVA